MTAIQYRQSIVQESIKRRVKIALDVSVKQCNQVSMRIKGQGLISVFQKLNYFIS